MEVSEALRGAQALEVPGVALERASDGEVGGLEVASEFGCD